MLDSGSADAADIVKWASERVLESYRNGITASLLGAAVTLAAPCRIPPQEVGSKEAAKS